jgi:hypothetical protein
METADESWTYVATSLFESLFSLTKFLNMVMVQNFEVELGQTLNHSLHNCVIICGVIYLSYLTCYFQFDNNSFQLA